jgi:hypothetical protein
MAMNDRYDKGPTHGGSARGYSAAYQADRVRAEQELRSTMAGHTPEAVAGDTSLKNPYRELQAPASMPDGAAAARSRQEGPGPNEVGNSRGDGSIDPQGQQGGTEGGQPGSSAIAIGGRQAGTPLAGPDDRRSRRFDQKAPRPIPPGALPGDKM